MSKVYGYARISRKEQSIERQIRNIKSECPEAYIFSEAFTGTKIEGRKEFERLLKVVRAGDTIIFDSVSRMSRNAEQGIELYERLMADGVNLVFLKEHYIDTETFKQAQKDSISMTGNEAVDAILEGVNKALAILRKKQIEQAFAQAQKEVDDLHQRTKEGIETARINGKQIGQLEGKTLTVKKAAPAKEIIRQHSKSFGGTLTDAECMKLAGVANNTYYKYKKEIMMEMAEG